jgi:hypothetical protein
MDSPLLCIPRWRLCVCCVDTGLSLLWRGMASQETKKKKLEEAANVKLDKVLTAFRLVKNNKFAELEDMLMEGTCFIEAPFPVG